MPLPTRSGEQRRFVLTPFATAPCKKYEKHFIAEEEKRRKEPESQGETYTPYWMQYIDY